MSRTGARALYLAVGLAGFAPLAGWADSAAPSRFAQSDDEKSLSDVQLLGKRIFEDTNLSEPRGLACQACHQPQHAFQGVNGSPIPGIAAGSTPDKIGHRKSPTLMYKTYSPAFGFYKDLDDGKETLEAKGGQMWDGRASDMVEQATLPMLDPAEMNNPSIEAVVEKVKAGPYADLVRTVYGDDAFADPKAAMSKLTAAIFAYEVTERFAPFSSKFDDYLRGKAKLTPAEARGFELFTDPKRGNCIACHVGRTDSKDPTDWIFTDFTYDALGAPRNAAIPANADASTFDLGLCKQPGLAAKLPKEIKLESLCGAFKVPTLRNVAVAGAYYHNAVFTSLRDAVAIYATRDTDPGRWFPRLKSGEADKFNDLPGGYKANVNTDEVPYDRHPGQRPRLSDQDIDALVAFLGTLTDKGMQ
ncbi:cytochrome c peroxidase [Roseiarcus fermentans]|uniref:Cytochrome c peroxidase n=1 Tax=Roseiarcus fermentans TaxID=1473586 RepID=A0A366FIA6_9HYPH|nr:cytochrome c peroxidase [Roseiarcus fermentans]RBP14388.1 cytochrome c peroxidase [Roseiarcus fermentans]